MPNHRAVHGLGPGTDFGYPLMRCPAPAHAQRCLQHHAPCINSESANQRIIIPPSATTVCPVT